MNLSLYSIFFFLLVICPTWAWDSFSDFPSMEIPYHPVSTKNKEAQEAFNQGILGIYGFNYEGAYAKFAEAAHLDPLLAMAYWGMALSLDEEINDNVSAQHAHTTYDLAQKAVELSKNSTPNEQAYINALITRFSKDSTVSKKELRKNYKDAMEKVVKDFPDDLDATTLYAESLMDMQYWEFWTINGKALENTKKIIDILNSVLQRNPHHVGANHYQIHALENSLHPEQALICAYRLDHLAYLFADWAHLLHTPSHIFMHVGYYQRAIENGKRSVKADEEYIKKHGLKGDYPLHGLTHNLSFLIMAYLWSECYEQSLESAQYMSNFVKPHIKNMPGFQYDMLYIFDVYLYFHRWEEILKEPEPLESTPIVHAYWHYAKGMAFAGLKQLDDAKKEQKAFLKERASLEKKEHFDKETFHLAEYVLSAAIKYAENDLEGSLIFLKKAIEHQDQMGYLDWYVSLRQTLGARLLEMKRAKEAEEVFRQSLQHLPLNGRSLFGLTLSLRAQGKEDYWSHREMKEALKYSQNPLKLEDL